MALIIGIGDGVRAEDLIERALGVVRLLRLAAAEEAADAVDEHLRIDAEFLRLFEKGVRLQFVNGAPRRRRRRGLC